MRSDTYSDIYTYSDIQNALDLWDCFSFVVLGFYAEYLPKICLSPRLPVAAVTYSLAHRHGH